MSGRVWVIRTISRSWHLRPQRHLARRKCLWHRDQRVWLVPELERVTRQQLKDIKLRWETPAPVMAPPDQTPGKMTAMNCVTVDSSDEDGLVSHEHGDPPAPVSSVDSKNSTLSPSQRVAQFFVGEEKCQASCCKSGSG